MAYNLVEDVIVFLSRNISQFSFEQTGNHNPKEHNIGRR
jgi:hypothetical protein